MADNIGKFWQTLISGDRAHRMDRVIEKLAASDRVTLTVERLPEGKMRVTSGSWDNEKVLSPGQVLDQVPDVPNVDNRLHIAPKPRKPDESDPPIEPS